MSSEIRTGSALAPSAAKSGSAEISLQNPLFSIGGQDGFSQVLKQVGARDESRRPSQSEQGVKSSDARRETKADPRQDSGKSLPERPTRDADARVERPTSRKAADNQRQDEAENTQAATGAGAQPQTDPHASEQSKTAEGDSAVPTSQQGQDAAQPAGDQVSTDATLTAEESVLAELAAMQAEAESGDVSSPTNPSSAISSEAGSTIEGEAVAAEGEVTELAPSELATESENDGGEETIDVDMGSEKPQGEPASGTPLQAQMSMLSPKASTGDQQVAATPGDAAAKQPGTGTAQTGSPAPKATDVVTTMTSNAVEGNEPAAEGKLPVRELGHEPTAAEKNAEKNADFTRQMAAASERAGPLKEQLAALAQQIKGDTESRHSKPGASKAEAVTDIKPTAFGRSLEQLSNARIDSAKPVSTGVQTLVGQREWASEMGQRLMMMVSSKLKSAEIHLNPKDLGPVEVRIRMHEDKAHVVFTSQVPQTREALEQAMPRLREMFDQNGVALGSVDVQDHGARHSNQQEQTADGRQNGASDGGGNVEGEIASDKVPVRMIGLVDYYA